MVAFPYVPLIDLLNAVTCALCSYRLFQSYHRNPQQQVVLFFAQGYYALIVSYLFFALPRFVTPESSFFIGAGFVAAQAFLYLGVAFFAKVIMYFIKPAQVDVAFKVVLVVATIGVLMSIIFFAYPAYDTATSITVWNIHPIVSVISMVVFVGVLAPGAIVFSRLGVRSRDRTVRIRSGIIAVGLLLLIVTAYTYYAATTFRAAFISDIFSVASYLIIFIGVMYGRDRTMRPAIAPHHP